MTCCMHAQEERLRADRIERESIADFHKAVAAVDKLQARNRELEAALRSIFDAANKSTTEQEWADLVSAAMNEAVATLADVGG